jgi:hypothetical protein
MQWRLTKVEAARVCGFEMWVEKMVLAMVTLARAAMTEAVVARSRTRA